MSYPEQPRKEDEGVGAEPEMGKKGDQSEFAADMEIVFGVDGRTYLPASCASSNWTCFRPWCY